MKLKKYQYSVLKYRPSYFLREEVNIGLLFFFVEDQHIAFEYPNKLGRLTHFYPDTDLSTIRTYLKGFQRLAKRTKVHSTALTRTILSELLLEDASSFYFSDIKNGGYQSVEDTLAYYRKAYFQVYEPSVKKERKDEKYLNQCFERELEQYQTVKRFFQRGATLKNQLQQTKFDFAWKNGSVNYVKSISFDLKERDSIQNKSFRWFGELTKLGKKAEKEDLQFDLLISKPRSSKLFGAYEKAIKILEDVQAPKRLIEEEDLKDYIKKAAETVIGHNEELF